MRILWGKYAYPVDMVELDILLEKSILIPTYLSLEFTIVMLGTLQALISTFQILGTAAHIAM